MKTAISISSTVDFVDKTIILRGWVDSKRDHGKVTFVDLRDRTGIIQCVGFQKMGEVTPETVLEVTGLVKTDQQVWLTQIWQRAQLKLKSSHT